MKKVKGIVIKSTGSWYQVQAEDSNVYSCRIKGKFRIDGKKLTNPVAVGDNVNILLETIEEKGIINEILPRKNYVVRHSPSRKFHLHLLASNIDQALVVTTIKEPNLKIGFIDRFLLMTEPHNIPVIIVINKADLLDEEDLMIYKGLKSIYEKIGYRVLLTSTITGEGIEALKAALKNKMTLVSGHSGVGKSTLINTLQPNLALATKEISEYSGKGQHTTTFAEMHTLDFGGKIIDSPGIKSLSFINLEAQDVAHNFKEFFEVSANCKFSNCMHLNEPKCAVKAAIEEGEISELRYENYLQILEEINAQNHWERNSDF